MFHLEQLFYGLFINNLKELAFTFTNFKLLDTKNAVC
jgi:hypothetical protein